MASIPHDSRHNSTAPIPHHAPDRARYTQHRHCKYSHMVHVAAAQSNLATPYRRHPTHTGQLQTKTTGQTRTGTKAGGQNPAAKVHKLLQGPVTIDIANTLLRLPPHLPPLESHQVRERILSMNTGPPPPSGRVAAAALGTGTPVHHAWCRPHPPPVDHGHAGSGHPHQSACPSHNARKPAHPLAEKDVACLAQHYAHPPIMVSALCGQGLRGPEDKTSTPSVAAPLLCPLVSPRTPPPTIVRRLCQAGADHLWGHAAPCTPSPPCRSPPLVVPRGENHLVNPNFLLRLIVLLCG